MLEEPSASGGDVHGGGGGSDAEANKRPSTKEKLLQEITSKIEESKSLQAESIDLHTRADEVAEHDPQLAEDLRFKAREIDKKATRLLKTARRLESGWMQGGAAGAGIGAGIATGIGMTVGSRKLAGLSAVSLVVLAAVGSIFGLTFRPMIGLSWKRSQTMVRRTALLTLDVTVVSGLAAIPTTGLGILIGAGTGLVHGPWVKFTEALTKDEVSEIDREAEEEAKRIGES